MDVNSFIVGIIATLLLVGFLLIYRLYQLLQVFKKQIDNLSARSLSYETIYVKDREKEILNYEDFKQEILSDIETKNTEFYIETMDSVKKQISKTKNKTK
tara:strand:- start:2930 stop:3229 length:300 start_codon:yes stop_codon:yes gene_type:complete